MNIYQMRDLVEEVYNNDSWKLKVEKMSDDQIVALYYRLVRDGKIK